ncbi:helix-turn-helix transcriptional regulator [Dyadobacter sp. LJ53]|uniref:winged helix-turn-helix transcriptional regulator n=1 Tax=Dyadobacter chenwenxiniae TaxID=2906456 RepID=UPI001F393750|nr:helix-turn-helix domain-containing protein [Dyadobacter chenwenxiniae]MCF0049307.1 helix-turn-helix transcriptional regulator [Dyadobacter chenwenxiniae]
MTNSNNTGTCQSNYVLAINDTLNVLSGKWKLPIIAAMSENRNRFNDIRRAVPKLTPGMLSKELRDLEMNGIIERQVHDGQPMTIVYELTASAKLLSGVIDKMIEWGLQHRDAAFRIETSIQP